jgi:hypothetical protein
MLYPSLLGKVLLELLLGYGDDLPFLVKYNGSGAGGSLIQSQNVRFVLGHFWV